MSKARVYEIAKQVGVDNKALVDTLNKLGIEGKSHMGSLADEEVNKVMKYYENNKGAKPATPAPAQESDKKPEQPAAAPQAAAPSQTPAQTPSQTPAQTSSQTPVQTPSQTSVQTQGQTVSSGYQGNRPQGQSTGYQGNRPQDQSTGYQGNRPQGQSTGYQGNRPQGQGTGYQGQSGSTGYQGNRPQGQSTGYQGNRPQGQGQTGGTGYQGQSGSTGYQGNRPQGQSTGYQGNRPQGQGTGYQGQSGSTGYQGNRPQGNRPQGQSTGYQGNRPQGQGQTGGTGYQGQSGSTGYQGNRPQGQSTGYQGNRPQGQGTGYQGQSGSTGYQGNRPAGSTGYQGNRPAGQGQTGSTGYQGNRPAGSTGYQGNKPAGSTGYQGNKPGGSTGYQGNKTGGSTGYQGQRPAGQGQSGGQRPAGQGQNRPGQRTPNQAYKPKQTGKTRANARKAKEEAIILAEETNMIIKIPEMITVKDLSLKVRKQASDIVKILFLKGIMATANQELTYEVASQIAEELEFLCEKQVEEDIFETFTSEEPDLEEDLEKRPPIVVVMGHVDHGKTSLLDAIRKSKVTEGEHGGITQHIGASVVTINGQKITFLDTPGHEAFTAMRLRGAMATDIAILVVAADDGVMPQTIEAINHAKAAGVQIIVAINKIDKPGANADRVKQELTEYGLLAEDWGGDTICVEVSAIAKTGLDTLLEMVLLVAEMAELKANPNREARGTVIESQLDKGRGPVATVLVQNGTLNVGDTIIAGSAYGRIRAMMDDKGRRVKTATPSMPVEVLGLSEVPIAGDAFYTAENEKVARQIADRVTERTREKMISHTPHKVTLDDLFSQIKEGETKELKVIVKADVQGSVEAMRQSLNKLSNEKVVINVIHGGVGAINESDVMLASASNTIIIGFNVRPEAQAKIKADVDGVDIRLYRVIYNALEDIESAMKGMLDPEFREKILGHAVIRQTFKVSGVGTIAGAYVTDGKLVRNAKVRLLRDNVVVYEGDLDSLKRFKDDAKEVASNYECGVTLTKYNDIKEEDIIEAFIMEEIPR